MSEYSIATPWPHLKIYAAPQGEIHPHEIDNAHLFRGEEVFEDGVEAWRRWSKPSPEPPLDDAFDDVLLDAIKAQSTLVAAMTSRVADQIMKQSTRPPLLVAVLRAGVPLCALLAKQLEKRCDASFPVVALSLFHGLGWDEAALQMILEDFPDREIWFVDGWTSGGGVAKELQDSWQRWKAAGKADFTNGNGPQLAVWLDPKNVAQASAIQTDVFIASSCFTAPETLGFGRGFAFEDGSLFGVYTFPESMLRPRLVEAWLQIAQVEPDYEMLDQLRSQSTLPPQSAPPEIRIHINEVVRALINRAPREVLLAWDEGKAREELAPVLHLCQLRDVPVRFGASEVLSWGALAAARMK